MELVLSFTCERDIFMLEFHTKLSLENFSVKSKNISGFLKSVHRAGRRLITACPCRRGHPVMRRGRGRHREMVEPIGIEPMTFWLQTRRSPS